MHGRIMYKFGRNLNITVITCTGMHALKPKLLGNRCTTKHAFSHIFIRIQVGYTVQYIDLLKSYLNLNKYMVKKRVLWGIYFQVLGFWCMHSSTRYYGKDLFIKKTYVTSKKMQNFTKKLNLSPKIKGFYS